jgi:cAMP-specific phosphodiesterase 4
MLADIGLLNHFTADMYQSICHTMRTLILATDMLRQPYYLSRVNELIRRGSDCARPANRDEKLFIMQLMIKCADISNPCRPWRLSQEWSYRASTEFFAQGDHERRLGLPVTAFCDRLTTSIPKIQSGFMEYLARPLFVAWNSYAHSPLTQLMLTHLLTNQRRWDELLQSEIDAGSVTVNRHDSSVPMATLRAASINRIRRSRRRVSAFGKYT